MEVHVAGTRVGVCLGRKRSMVEEVLIILHEVASDGRAFAEFPRMCFAPRWRSPRPDAQTFFWAADLMPPLCPHLHQDSRCDIPLAETLPWSAGLQGMGVDVIEPDTPIKSERQEYRAAGRDRQLHGEACLESFEYGFFARARREAVTGKENGARPVLEFFGKTGLRRVTECCHHGIDLLDQNHFAGGDMLQPCARGIRSDKTDVGDCLDTETVEVAHPAVADNTSGSSALASCR